MVGCWAAAATTLMVRPAVVGSGAASASEDDEATAVVAMVVAAVVVVVEGVVVVVVVVGRGATGAWGLLSWAGCRGTAIWLRSMVCCRGLASPLSFTVVCCCSSSRALMVEVADWDSPNDMSW